MIEPRYGVLQTLFADRVFRIPHYQRFYSWQKRKREDLFNDLKKSDTPRGAGGLMSWAVSKTAGPWV